MKAVFTLTLSIIMFLPVINRAQETPTFEIIQTEIFNTNCVSCHQPGTSFARQSGLVAGNGQGTIKTNTVNGNINTTGF